MPPVRDFLLRGLLAGLVAGVAAFAVGYLVGEPSLNAAIALEGAGHPAPAADEGAGMPRVLQSTLGLLTGIILAGTTLGGLVGVLSALALGRFGSLSPRGTTLLVAGLGAGALFAIPYAGYPPSPPGVGQADTIGVRSALYAVLLAVSILAAVTAVLGGRWLARRWGTWYAALAATAGYLVTVTVGIAAMPSYDEVPPGFPAAMLYQFRTASFLTSMALWTVLGVVLAELVHRLVRRTSAVPAPRHPAEVAKESP